MQSNIAPGAEWDLSKLRFRTTMTTQPKRLPKRRGKEMEVKVAVKNGELSDAIEDKIRQKMAKLPRYFDRITGIQVIADMKHAEPKVEAIVSAENTNDFFASEKGVNVLVLSLIHI